MKKPLPIPTVEDQILPTCESKNRRAATTPGFVTRLDPTLLGKHQPVSYIPSDKPRKEPAVIPRLFIRGHGGSIKLDLGGVGIGFSEAVFAHFVSDDSLRSLHVCRGDIALIEPAVRRVHDGNLVLLEIDGHPVIRRLRREKRIWMLELVDQGSDGSIPSANWGIQGVVLGFVRLFNKLRPVRYEGTDAKYSMGFEIPSRPRRRREQAELLDDLRSRVRLVRRRVDIRHLFSVNEVDEGGTPQIHGNKPAKSKVLRPAATTSLSPCATGQDVDSASKPGSKRESASARQQGKVPPADSPGDLERELERIGRENRRLLRENGRLIRQMLGDNQALRSVRRTLPTAMRAGSTASTGRSPYPAIPERQQHAQEPVAQVLPDRPTSVARKQAKLASTANDDDKSAQAAARQPIPSGIKARRAGGPNVKGSVGD